MVAPRDYAMAEPVEVEVQLDLFSPNDSIRIQEPKVSLVKNTITEIHKDSDTEDSSVSEDDHEMAAGSFALALGPVPPSTEVQNGNDATLSHEEGLSQSLPLPRSGET